MSLHSLANHLQSAGRGQDSVLVHMTPGEVKGLQSLAMAHGGSLTINPETGLPEAGILRSLLPMIAGFALGPAGFGLFKTATTAGLAVGAATGLATGSLKQGLMAGLGAYGGAGLGQGLMAQGAQGASTAGAAGAGGPLGTAVSPATANPQLFNTAGAASSGPLASNIAGTTTAAPTNLGLSAYKAPTPVYNIGQYPNKFIAPPVATPPAVVGSPPVVTPTPPTVVTGAGGPNPAFNQSFAGGPTSAYTAPSTYNVGANLGATGTEGIAASQATPSAFSERMAQLGRGTKTSFSSMEGLKGLYEAMPTGSVAAGLGSVAMGYTDAQREKAEEEMRRRAGSSNALIRPYEFSYGATGAAEQPYTGSAERTYFNPMFTAQTPYAAPGPEYAAEGGLMGYAVGGPVEQMAAMNSVGMNTGYPMANLQTPMYSNPAMQRPEAMNVIAPSAGAGVGAYSGEQRFAAGGVADLGGYSDGGRLLKGPGDGVSDSIPASIGGRQPARLADGEFVVPARIVSELGNGSTEAGARKLYAMMDRVQKARRKTVGKKQVAKNTQAEKLLPA